MSIKYLLIHIAYIIGPQCMEEGVTIPRNNLVKPLKNIKTKEDCCNACQDMEECTFFSWNKKKEKCSLKNSDTGRKANKNTISGSENCCTGNMRLIIIIGLFQEYDQLLIW